MFSKTRAVIILLFIPLAFVTLSDVPLAMVKESRHPVPSEHPRLLGSLRRLQFLSEQRPEAYSRVVEVARYQKAGP